MNFRKLRGKPITIPIGNRSGGVAKRRGHFDTELMKLFEDSDTLAIAGLSAALVVLMLVFIDWLSLLNATRVLTSQALARFVSGGLFRES